LDCITEYSLEQNYPNPFNPTTKIKYTIPSDGIVKLKIYDALGQEIKTLVNGFQTRGYKTINWNGTNSNGQHVSSGLYVYRIEAGKFIQSKKMIFLR
jgi:flagellar hook assembly protein FlgD